ncbi:hypothetical protein BAY59_24340 [Prauserella coralliicola]|nr:hypothetical protein BAY59_24340 [Prauserella coralliicola]
MPRRQQPDPWPWPADTPLDRARRIAHEYRQYLLEHAAEVCAQLDQRARDLGQGWVAPQPVAYEMDDLLTVEQAADYCQVKPRTVDAWRQRGLQATRTPDGVRYLVRHLHDYQADRRKRRVS